MLDDLASRGRAPTSSDAPVRVVYEDEDFDEPTLGSGACVGALSADPEASDDEPTACGPLFVFRAGAKSSRGARRRVNQDAMLVLEKEGIFAVADGMGGHSGGELASQLAVEAIATTFQARSVPRPLSNIAPRAAQLVHAFAAANEVVRAAAAKKTEFRDMGTTLVALKACPEKRRIYVAHVGDSRCYRLRQGKVVRLTRDHTLAAYGVRGREAGFLSRAVGVNGILEVDIFLGAPCPGDVYLLCSDGLTKVADDDDIADILDANPDPATAAERLVEFAVGQGGGDDVTVVVLRMEAATAP
jgi:serine/threonine protein phosphatase PrpC